MSPSKKRFLELREQPAANRSVLLGALGVIGFFGIWELGHYLTAESSRKFVPSVEQVAAALYDLFANRNFLHDIVVSCRRVFVSFLAAAAIGVPIGILMGCFGNMRALLNPTLSGWRYLPAASFIPLLLVWFGPTDLAKMALLFLGVIFFLVSLILDNTAAVQKELVEASLTMGASRREVVAGVVVPAAMPAIFDSMRNMIAVAWTYLVIAEIVGAQDGIGAVMMRAGRFLNPVNLALGAFALFSLTEILGFSLDTTGKAIALVVVTVLTFGVAILGHATIVVLQRIFTWTLALIMMGLIPQVWAAPPLPVAADAASGASFAILCVAFTLIAALPISFTNYPADYTRYLPRATSGSSITLWIFLGSYIATAIMMIVGFVAAKTANLSGPVAGFKPLLAPWYFKLFLIVVLGGTMTNNFVNTFSSGMSLLAAGLKVSRPMAIVIDGIMASAMAAYAIFYYDFTPSFIAFLSLMVAWLAPWAGVYTADIWLRKSEYSGADLLSDDGGQYRYGSGWNMAGYVTWLAGVGVAVLCTTADMFKSPFAEKYLGGADLSIVAGFLVSAVLYVLLAGRAVRAS